MIDDAIAALVEEMRLQRIATLKEFLELGCIRGTNESVPDIVLWKAYCAWCNAAGRMTYTPPAFRKGARLLGWPCESKLTRVFHPGETKSRPVRLIIGMGLR